MCYTTVEGKNPQWQKLRKHKTSFHALCLTLHPQQTNGSVFSPTPASHKAEGAAPGTFPRLCRERLLRATTSSPGEPAAGGVPTSVL